MRYDIYAFTCLKGVMTQKSYKAIQLTEKNIQSKIIKNVAVNTLSTGYCLFYFQNQSRIVFN
jgi:hypothetical protein